MNRILTTAIVTAALAIGSIATITPANAAPTYGLQIDSGERNPFSAEDK